MSRNDHQRIVERHLLECIEPAHWLKASGCQAWIDFGSGAGLPGIPLAIAGVGKSWLLVESRRSKVLFMTRTISELGLSNVEAFHARLETLVESGEHQAKFDAITSRATTGLAETLELAAPLVKSGGCAFLWKGSGRDREMKDEPWIGSWDLDSVEVLSNGLNAVCKFNRK